MKDVLIFTVHKAASMFLHRLAKEITNELSINHYSVNNPKYYDEIKEASWKTFIEKKSQEENLNFRCFAPIRQGETKSDIPNNLSRYSIVLHVRDPRDVLTSLFFSHVYSHSRKPGRFNPSDAKRKQWEEEGVDKHVLKNLGTYKEKYQSLISNLLNQTNCTLIKYEDMVLNYSEWLNLLLFSFPVSNISNLKKVHKKLYQRHKYDFVPPVSEQIYKHTRRILPGDHREKLTSETIDILNYELKEVLEAFSYPLNFRVTDSSKVRLKANQVRIEKINAEIASLQ